MRARLQAEDGLIRLPNRRTRAHRAAVPIGDATASASGVIASLIVAILCCTASAASADEPLKLADSQLEPVKWTDLAGWMDDDRLAAFTAYQTSCRALRKTPRTDDHGPNAWRPVERVPQSRRPPATRFGWRSHILRAEFSARSYRASGRGSRTSWADFRRYEMSGRKYAFFA